MKARGQSAVFLLVVLPVLILLAGVLIRDGQLLLTHHRLENHCNKRLLDALALQGRGLTALSKYNRWAKALIDLKRKIEKSLTAKMVPAARAAAIAAIAAIRMQQVAVAAAQKSVMNSYLLESAAALSMPPSHEDLGKDRETFGPKNPALSHASKGALLLHVTPLKGYEDEIGPPYELDGDFSERQAAWGKIVFHSEKYLEKWHGFKPLPDVLINCRAHLEMKKLEGSWTARLIPVADKPSLNLL